MYDFVLDTTVIKKTISELKNAVKHLDNIKRTMENDPTKPMWYNKTTGIPTGAQNREFFATMFAYTVMGNVDRITECNQYFPTATKEMEEIMKNSKN